MEKFVEYSPGGYGENIWDISSWTTDINWKDAHLRRHFDNLTFLECIRDIVDLSETYFQSAYEVFSEEEEEGVEYDFPYLDIIVLLTEEYLYGHFFQVITPLQELSMLEILCSYFQNKPLDPIRYFVFDCLFGFPNETSELQKGLLGHKTTLMSKLTSMAVGTRCGNLLNCVAVWFHTYGSQNRRAAKVAFSVVNDYFLVCPEASGAVADLIDVAPVFAYQFLVALASYYKYQENDKSNKHNLPPTALIEIVSEWIIEKPRFCVVKIPSLFLRLPSIHNFDFSRQDSLFRFCPILSTMRWCLLDPLVKKHTEEETKKSMLAYSKLLYSFLSYISMQRKIEINKIDNPDDLEPGELSDEETGEVELMTKEDVAFLIHSLRLLLERYANVDDSMKKISVDRLVQIVQVSKWAGCTSATIKDLKGYFIDIPKTTLLISVLKSQK